jgi:hypothetical protein
MSLIAIVTSIGTINWFVLESLWTKSKLRNGYRVFAPPAGLKFLYFIGIPAFIYGAVVSYLSSPREKWISALLLIIAALCVCFFPATIFVSREKLIAFKWLGMRKMQMNWRDVKAVYSSPESDSIIIQDKNQNRIIHTVLNIDREGFIRQVTQLPKDILSGITIQI